MTDVPACAERGMSAPPEVVFNTAIDPTRVAAWLPAPLRDAGVRRPAEAGPDMHATWDAAGRGDGWSAVLQVHQLDAGGAVARLELNADAPPARLAEIADESLISLAREVADNLTAG